MLVEKLCGIVQSEEVTILTISGKNNIDHSAFVEMKLREYIVLFEAGLKKDFEWARGGLNPGPRAYQARALTRLSHGPTNFRIFET